MNGSDTDTDTDTDTNDDGGTEGTNDTEDASVGTSSTPTTGEGSDGETTEDSLDETGVETTGAPHDECEFTEDFEGVADGEPWPDPWFISGGVAEADVVDGRGRLRAMLVD